MQKLDTSPQALAQELLGRPYEDLDADEQRVLCRVMSHEVNLDPDEQEVMRARFGDRLADKVAAVGGSWGFIIAFVVLMGLWMGLNTLGKAQGWAWDEYPFILLNLALSTLAALQAPVILMSQNRQAHKDRISNRHDYEVNLRTTVELLILQRKVDRIFNKLGHLEHTVDDVAVNAEVVAGEVAGIAHTSSDEES